MDPTRLIGLITSYVILLSILTEHHYVFSAHITGPPPTGNSSDYVVISEDEYVPGLHDYAGDPCTGAAIYERDIALPLIINPDTNTSYILLPSNYSTVERAKRGATANSYILWPNAIVYYTFDSSIIDSVKLEIYESMHHWEELTCLRFRFRTTERDYLEFFKGAGCCSYIGSLKLGRQKISIGPYCNYFSTITHEIGHAIGFWHEMNRPDRDEHIRIVASNIPTLYQFNFRKVSPYHINSRGFVYDYNSVMHYSASAFSRNGEDTIESIQEGIPIGPENGLTELDVNQTKAMYSCQQYGNRGSTLPSSATPLPEQSFFPNCGSLLTGYSGTFSFDTATDGRSLCEWLIKVPSGYSIRLVVDMVLPGRTGSCTNGIEVIDGHQLQGRSHGQYCGNFRKYTFLSSYNYMLIKMHTDNRALGGRFTGSYSARDVDECRYYGSLCVNSCQNTPGGFTCVCEDGYYVSRNKIRCFDINECAYDNGGCDHKCVNTGGSYTCSCNQGYTLNGDKKTCFPRSDPCRTNNGNCEHNCETYGNTYSCSCNAGFSLYTDNRRCVDVNECSSNPCPSSFECTNNLGSYTCSCPSGFVESGNQCNDINECNQNICDQTCTNTAGSFTCSCRDRFELYSHDSASCFLRGCSPGSEGCPCERRNGVCSCHTGYAIGNGGIFCQDVDECAVSNGGCALRCVNSIGSYTCACPVGQVHSQASNACVDEDECTTGTHLCEHGCINTDGSYYCVCLPGYQISDSYSCTDINECSSVSCGRFQSCVNTEGSYSCECQSGFFRNQRNGNCDDLDECSQGTDQCSQICFNTIGSYLCYCNEGYRRSSSTECQDIDECSIRFWYDCLDHQYCINSIGSYTCQCVYGYRKNLDTGACQDIDECTEGTHLCTQNCINEVGSYRCGCNEGYVASGTYECTDVNECSSPITNPCSERQKCLNLRGGYFCYCRSGYLTIDNECVDIDECTEGTHLCAQNCINEVGSYRCGCNEGYVASGTYECTDFNECSSPITNPCSERQRCLNLRGGYYCYCRSGYLTIDNECVDVDECLRGLCDQNCENTVGSYRCSCDSGFSLYRDRRSCSKPDCVAGTAGCRCIYSGFDCNCVDGYKLGKAGVFCQDIDECEINNGGCSHSCSNTPGSFQCSCPTGLELSWNAKTCIQITTCSEFNGGCEQICEETPTPGVRCLCEEDYVLSDDRKSCEVRTACHANGVCHHICTEVDARAQCSCRDYYQLAADQTSCSRNFYCTDSRICGQFCNTSTNTCACKEGFGLRNDGQLCEDIDECAFPHLSNCSNSCVNTDGSYVCTCPQGFWIGSDGKTCRENSVGCGGNNFSDTYGSLPYLTGPYPMQCVWSITVPQNELAVFRIYYIAFGRHDACTGVSIEVWDPRLPNNTRVGKQCTGAYENYFTAAGNKLEIRIDIERDYRLYYQFFYFGANNNNLFGSSTCGQSISVGRNFTSPNFPLSYNSNSDCSVYITSSIAPFYLKFNYLNLEWSEDCERDSITIRDVHSYNSFTRPLAKLCGNKVPEPIRSETRFISLVFQSDSSVQRGGFYATTYIY